MRLARRITVAALTAGLALGGVALAAPATGVTLRPLPVPDSRYCTAAVGHSPVAVRQVVPLHGRTCSALYHLDAPR
ncbi:hypothetical protein SAMN05216371_7350 [Streptomyces sp. TLI_053]|uniref:hypothetical protein n=1 Tax=Streptomyces sp. TLI_053 TaxID=1855352 RepID=UPI00087B9ADE|nr:hypothetical protein [Streptomyces sp. TLI_053]SDT82561.1 hypothetical protein SAMN05216371_7350 [Streptomyces sp. TLI_053]